MVDVTHTTQISSIADDPTFAIQPTQWNATHTWSMASDRYLGRITSGTGTVEELTAAQLGTAIGLKTVLTGNATYYVRTDPTSVSISNGTPAVATWTGHGLQADDPVVFSLPLDRGECTITIATPGVITKTTHGYAQNDPVVFATTGAAATPGVAGALPTNITAGVTYFVNAVNANTFKISLTAGGVDINTAGTQSGLHYVQRASTMPTGVTDGAIYYVLAAGLAADSFRFSATVAGAAINTTGAQVGKVNGQTGNDSNDGSAATRTAALLTLQTAYENVTALDFDNFTVRIQLADGTYYNGNDSILRTGVTSNMFLASFGSWLQIVGNLTNQDNVRLVSSGFVPKTISLAGTFPSLVTISNMRIEHDINEACVIISTPNSEIQLQNLTLKGGFEKIITQGVGTVAVLPVATFGTGKMYLIGDVGDSVITCGQGSQVFMNYNVDWVVEGALNCPGAFIIMNNNSGDLPSSLVQDGINFYGIITGLAYSIEGWALLQENTFTASSGLVSQDGLAAIVSLTAGVIGVGTNKYQGGRYVNNFNLVARDAKTSAPGTQIDCTYNYQAVLTGFSVTLGNFNGNVILDSSTAMATGTITMPPGPQNGQQVCVRTVRSVATLTVSPSAGQSVLGNPTALTAGSAMTAIYRSANTTWYCAT